MQDKCKEAVTQAAGRSLTQVELKNIEDRIRRQRKFLAQQDPNAYRSMTQEQQLQGAAKLAADELKAEAAKKQMRIQQTIKAHDRIDNQIKDMKQRLGISSLDAWERILAWKADGKSQLQPLESLRHAVSVDFKRQLLDTLDNLHPKMFGLLDQPVAMKAMTYELFGQDSSKIPGIDPETSALAKKAADEWSKVSEMMRQHFNAAGGEIGKLEDWRFPQSHSQSLVGQAGRTQWVNDILPALNRSKYMNDDGTMMDETQVRALLDHAWETITTGGLNTLEPGKITGSGMRANYHAEERVLHFKDADSYLAYQQKYSGTNPFSVMMHHMEGLSKDIATVEMLGPNPDLMARFQLEKAQKEDALAMTAEHNNKVAAGEKSKLKLNQLDHKVHYLESLYGHVSGKTEPVVNQAIATVFDTVRSWAVATKLGSAVFSHLSANTTLHLTAGYNNMSSTKLLRNQLQTLNPLNRDELRIAQRAGLSLQTLSNEVNRFGTETFAPELARKAASLTMRLGGLNAMVEGTRRAFGVTMYGSMGHLADAHPTIADMHPADRAVMKRNGISEDTFQVWKKAQLEDWSDAYRGNDKYLTPDSIYKISDADLASMGDPSLLRRDAALKLIGMVNDEAHQAVAEPTATQKTKAAFGTRRGTIGGEFMRSFMLFKSYPTAVVGRNWARMSSLSNWSKALYLAKFIAGTTLFGAASVQIANLINGRDPQNMLSWKFWIAALLKGGSMGIYGDFLLNTNTQYGNTLLGTVGGPVMSGIEDTMGLTQGTFIKYAKGEKTHFGAEAIRYLKNNTPLQNLWYTKAITDRLIFNQLQELASPGYMNRVEQKAHSEFGQSFYWKPGAVLPQRAPDLEKVIKK